MNKTRNSLLLGIMAMLISIGIMLTDAPVLYAAGDTNATLTDTMRGVFVYTYENRDFPSKNGLSAKQLKQEIADLVRFAKESGYNSIYFEAVPAADAMYQSKLYPHSGFWVKKQGDFSFADPLELLVEEAEKNSIAVYALINPYLVGAAGTEINRKNLASNPALTVASGDNVYLNPTKPEVQAAVCNVAEEILKKYKVAGVALHGLDAPFILQNPEYIDSAQQLVTTLSSKVSALSPAFKFGVVLRSESSEFHPYITQWAEENTIDFLTAIINTTTISQEKTYQDSLDMMTELLLDSAVELYSGNMASRLKTVSSDGQDFDDVNEINYQLFTNGQNGINGFVIDSYHTLKNNFHHSAENIMTLFSAGGGSYPDINLKIPTTFAVTRPISPFETTLHSFFIVGTSDPKYPVYLDGRLVPSDPQKGTFGMLVDVKNGQNDYVLTQNDKEITVTIHRSEVTEDPVVAISDITSSSVTPQISSALSVLDTIMVSCTAPAGGKVTATLDGMSIALEPVANAEKGTPVTYRATIEVPDRYPKNETSNLGKVTYALTYDGKITTKKSPGNVYVSGADARLAITVTDYIAGIYLDPTKEGQFLTTLKNGSTDYVLGQTSTHYKLKSGGYVKKTAVDIIEDTAQIDNTVSSFAYNLGDKNESLILSGTSKVPFTADMRDGALIITLYNTEISADLPEIKSNLFYSVTMTKISDQTYSFRFDVKPNTTLWGYNIEYSDDNTIFYFKAKPTLSTAFGKPLENVSVVLDPGHGGKDPGTIGVAGANAPMEAQANLAVAYAAKHRLEQLGATVQMTRYDDTFVALNDRMRIAEQMKPDFFIALHHNSIAISSDGNKAFGTEVYYHESTSEQLAMLLEKNISSANRRLSRGYFEDYYLVTRMTYTPSVLAELGFLANPLEYADVTDALSMYKTSCAISQSIMECLAEEL